MFLNFNKKHTKIFFYIYGPVCVTTTTTTAAAAAATTTTTTTTTATATATTTSTTTRKFSESACSARGTTAGP